MHRREVNVWKGVVAGVAGGLAGTAAMGLLQSIRGDKPQLSKKFHKDLSHLGQPPNRNHIRMSSHPAVQEIMRESPAEMAAKSEYREPAAVAVAETVSQTVFHHHLTENELHYAAPTAQYGVGVTVGAAYGLATEYAPQTAAGYGTAMGVGLAAVKEEIVKPSLGLSGNPLDQPFSAHAWEMLTHAVFGVTCEAVRRLVRAVL